MKKQIGNSEIEKDVIALVRKEKEQWQTGSAFITEKVSFEMREILRKARKNYYSIFDEPKDPNTGLDKIFVPLTEWTIEAYCKNIDLDTKDINVRASKGSFLALRLAQVVRQILKNVLEKLGFADILDDGQRSLCIDGTWVQKSWKGFDPFLQKVFLRTSKVDLLNWWIDPAARDIQSATAVIERAVLTPNEVETYRDYWLNADKIDFKRDIASNSDSFTGNNALKGEVPAIDVYERWGKMPKYFITGSEADRKVWIEGMIVVSGLESGAPLVQKVIENTKRQKPYEEVWLRRVPGRWYGRGVAEQLFSLQEYLNETVNTRRINNLALQNRLFQVRKGSGITPQMLAKMTAGGAIPVTNLDQDIKELPVSDQKASSYKDEEIIYTMSDRVTGAYDITRGEQLPSTTPATNAILQNQNAKSGYVLVQEGIGSFLKRIIEKSWMPIIFEVLDTEEVIDILGDVSELSVFDELLIKDAVSSLVLKSINETGFAPDVQDLELFRQRAKEQLRSLGKRRVAKIKKSLLKVADYEVDVYVTNEDFDKATTINNLNAMLTTYSKLTQSALDVDMVIREVLDVMGIGAERFFLKDKQAVPMNPLPQTPQLNQVEQFTNANLPTRQVVGQ